MMVQSVNEKARLYRLRVKQDPERRQAAADYQREYRLKNPLRSKLRGSRHHTAKKGNRVDDFSQEDLLKYWEARGISATHCFYTGLPLGDSWELDHKIPRSRGGGHTLDNLVPCTKEINKAKHEMTDTEFFDWLGRLVDALTQRQEEHGTAS